MNGNIIGTNSLAEDCQINRWAISFLENLLNNIPENLLYYQTPVSHSPGMLLQHLILINDEALVALGQKKELSDQWHNTRIFGIKAIVPPPTLNELLNMSNVSFARLRQFSLDLPPADLEKPLLEPFIHKHIQTHQELLSFILTINLLIHIVCLQSWKEELAIEQPSKYERSTFSLRKQ